MANEQLFGYDISKAFGNNDSNITLWDSSEHGELEGKIICISIQLSCECQNTSPRNGTYEIILESNGMTTIFGDSEEVLIGSKTVGAASRPTTSFSKLLNSKSLAADGACDVKVVLKKKFAAISNKLSGTVTGTIKCTVVPYDEETKQKAATLGLDKNAITDWFKSLSVDGAKSGTPLMNEDSIGYSFVKGSLGHTLWKSDSSNLVTEKVTISLDGQLTNSDLASKTVEFVFTASGDTNFSTSFASKTIPASGSIDFNVAGVFRRSQLPSDGVCDMKINITGTSSVSGQILGEVSVNSSRLSNAEADDYTDDSDIQGVLNNLFDEGYSVGGSNNGTASGTDSFMNAYSGAGYNDDSALINGDYHKTMGMTDEMATHLQQLEARITALENRMTELSVGGSDVDWYDGGSTGSDDTWGIGSWYEQTDDRINQEEINGFDEQGTGEGNVKYDLVFSPGSYDVTYWESNDGSYWGHKYGNCIVVAAEAYVIPEMVGKEYQSGSYDLLFSFNGKLSQYKSLWSNEGVIANVGVGCAAEWNRTRIDNFNTLVQFFSQPITGTFKDIKGEPVEEDCRLSVDFEAIFPYDTEIKKRKIIAMLSTTLEQINMEYTTKGQPFAKITGNLKYTVRDRRMELTSPEQVQGNVNLSLYSDRTNPRNVFYDITMPEGKVMKSLTYNLTLSYRYLGTECSNVPFHTSLYWINQGGMVKTYEKEFERFALQTTQQYVVKHYAGTINNQEITQYSSVKGYFDFVGDVTEEQFDDLFENFEGTITGNITYELQDNVKSIQAKDKETINEVIDGTFEGTQTVFEFNVPDTKVLTVDLSLTLSYTYDTAHSQLCVGKVLDLLLESTGFSNPSNPITKSLTIGKGLISGSKPSQQLVFRNVYAGTSLAENGKCSFKINFSALGLTQAELADMKQYFRGSVKGTVNIKSEGV